MKSLKLLFASLFISAALVMAYAPFTQAVSYPYARDWTFSVSSLAPTTTSKTFNIDFFTISTYLDDSFIVDLYQNGSKIQTQTTPVTNKAGNTGTFAVTVASDGTYNYTVTATIVGAPSEQKSDSTSTTVNSTAPNTITTIATTPAVATTTAATADATTGEVAGASATAAENARTGEVAGVTATAGDANKSVTAVAGAKIFGMSPAAALGILAALLLAIGAGWYIIGRMVDNKKQ